MAFYDIFNGDADGICALLQLRLHEPRDADLVTGVKRDIALLERVEAAATDTLTVLDISLDINRRSLERLLAAGASVDYFDHHHAGTIPQHPRLHAHIDADPGICTSLIVDRHLGGRFRSWAVVAAFGDNLDNAARGAAAQIGLRADETELLRELGVCINYNAYGESIDDLRFPPDALYRQLLEHADPLRFAREAPQFEVLRTALRDDLALAQEVPVEKLSSGCAWVRLPDQAWSRRVGGALANRLAQGSPAQAHAVLTCRPGGYLVSLRAPVSNPRGASTLARQFKSGGGREGAAGIDFLPDADLDRLLDLFRTAYGGN
jgi:hypothetical protein